jgi:hypothetical protein
VSGSININNFTKEDLIAKVIHLEHQVSLLQKMVFGSRGESFKIPIAIPANQLSLGVAVEPLAEVEQKKTAVKEHIRQQVTIKAKKHPGRTPLPSSLRRGEIIIEPQEPAWPARQGCDGLRSLRR